MKRTPGQRIKEVRNVLNKNQEEFGRLAGVTKSAVSQWECDRTIPERDPLLTLQRNAKINPDWVTNEKGEMFNKGQTQGVNEKRAPYSVEDEDLLKRIHRLSDADRARLPKIIDALDSKLDKSTSS